MAQPLLDHRSIGKYPAVIVLWSTSKPRSCLLTLSVAERIPQLPGHRLYDEPRLEMLPFESSFDRRFSFSAMIFRFTRSLYKCEARISPASANRRLTKKIGDRPLPQVSHREPMA